jgi:DNA mismatch repair protein MutL
MLNASPSQQDFNTGIVEVLPAYLVNRIAAGEVVERPASVLKELVENSVDAGASDISISVDNGGKTLVVADNGSGMSRADVERCVLNHATSKIKSAEDLERILSMGFRGEALASISAISRFECRSRRVYDADGTCLRIEGGATPKIHPIGTAVGTVMQVDDLFFNTPARLKFLKRAGTELSYCDEMAKSLALSHLHVKMSLSLNEKPCFTSTGTGDALETVQALFDFRPEQQAHLLTTQFEDRLSGLKIEAVFASPACESLQKKSKKQWWMILNNRPIRCAVLQRAIAAAYESLVPYGMSPFCVLWLTMPPDAVDVNVHPTKKEVRYADSGQIYQFVYTALRRALSAHFERVYGVENTPSPALSSASSKGFSSFATPQGEHENQAYSQHYPQHYPQNSRPAYTHTQQHLADFSPLAQASEQVSFDAPFESPAEESAWHPRAERHPNTKAKKWRVIGQLYTTYILLETPNGLMVVDQHIASERWCFEALQAQHDASETVVQRFVTPLELDLSPEEGDVLKAHLSQFEAVGFACEAVDLHQLTQWRIWGVPVLYPERNTPHSPIHQLKHMIEQLTHQPEAGLDTEHLYATMACHMAIRAGDVLTPFQQERVVEDWLTCTLPWSCPHGRPIAHTIDAQSLNNFFDRPSLPVNSGI